MLQYECDEATCPLGDKNCGNRHFQTLTKNLAQGKLYANGFEIIWYGPKGYGLRAIRTYDPGELIVEYTGDVISQDEIEKRLRLKYAGVTNYYFLSFEKGYVIDSGARGSVARFANHSCNPNAEMQKWYVNGEPRIGLFAGLNGVSLGEEITYDYNFDWFEGADPQPCFCGATNCRGTIGKRSSYSKEQSKEHSLPIDSKKNIIKHNNLKVEGHSNSKVNGYINNPIPESSKKSSPSTSKASKSPKSKQKSKLSNAPILKAKSTQKSSKVSKSANSTPTPTPKDIESVKKIRRRITLEIKGFKRNTPKISTPQPKGKNVSKSLKPSTSSKKVTKSRSSSSSKFLKQNESSPDTNIYNGNNNHLVIDNYLISTHTPNLIPNHQNSPTPTNSTSIIPTTSLPRAIKSLEIDMFAVSNTSRRRSTRRSILAEEAVGEIVKTLSDQSSAPEIQKNDNDVEMEDIADDSSETLITVGDEEIHLRKFNKESSTDVDVEMDNDLTGKTKKQISNKNNKNKRKKGKNKKTIFDVNKIDDENNNNTNNTINEIQIQNNKVTKKKYFLDQVDMIDTDNNSKNRNTIYKNKKITNSNQQVGTSSSMNDIVSTYRYKSKASSDNQNSTNSKKDDFLNRYGKRRRGVTMGINDLLNSDPAVGDPSNQTPTTIKKRRGRPPGKANTSGSSSTDKKTPPKKQQRPRKSVPMTGVFDPNVPNSFVRRGRPPRVPQITHHETEIESTSKFNSGNVESSRNGVTKNGDSTLPFTPHTSNIQVWPQFNNSQSPRQLQTPQGVPIVLSNGSPGTPLILPPLQQSQTQTSSGTIFSPYLFPNSGQQGGNQIIHSYPMQVNGQTVLPIMQYPLPNSEEQQRLQQEQMSRQLPPLTMGGPIQQFIIPGSDGSPPQLLHVVGQPQYNLQQAIPNQTYGQYHLPSFQSHLQLQTPQTTNSSESPELESPPLFPPPKIPRTGSISPSTKTYDVVREALPPIKLSDEEEEEEEEQDSSKANTSTNKSNKILRTELDAENRKDSENTLKSLDIAEEKQTPPKTDTKITKLNGSSSATPKKDTLANKIDIPSTVASKKRASGSFVPINVARVKKNESTSGPNNGNMKHSTRARKRVKRTGNTETVKKTAATKKTDTKPSAESDVKVPEQLPDGNSSDIEKEKDSEDNYEGENSDDMKKERSVIFSRRKRGRPPKGKINGTSVIDLPIYRFKP